MDRTHPLSAWMLDYAKTRAEVCAALGISKAHISQLLRGNAVATADLAEKIRTLTNGKVRPEQLPAHKNKGKTNDDGDTAKL